MPVVAPGGVCVLMSLYSGSSPADVNVALGSLWAQSQPADQVIVVEDGPLPPALMQMLDKHASEHPELQRVRLPQNRGLGVALQAGLNVVSTEFVARLDSDDVADPTRLEKQTQFLAEHPDIAVVGTAVVEFDDARFQATGDVLLTRTKVRSLAHTHEDLVRYARMNSPLNHPSIMARTAALKAVGGYRDVHYMEDYDLWARLITAGYRLHSMAEPLTFFRTSAAQVQRRRKKMFAAECQMQRNLVAYGLISRPRAMANVIIRSAYRAIPTSLLAWVNAMLFHRGQ